MTGKILVTGGSGYLGAHIARILGADDFSRRTGHDVTRPQDASLIAGYGAIVHLAASLDKSATAEQSAFDVNVGGTVNLVGRLRKDQTFLLMSTKDVYGRNADTRELISEECPIDRGWAAYEWSKFMAEECVEYFAGRAGARWGAFRLSSAYAPLTPGNKGTFVNFFAGAVRSGEKISLKNRGAQVRDFLHVDDLASAIGQFLSSSASGRFNIGGGLGNATSLAGLTGILGDLIGKSPDVELLDAPAPGQARYVTDTFKAKSDFGWSPQISLRAGLQTIL